VSFVLFVHFVAKHMVSIESMLRLHDVALFAVLALLLPWPVFAQGIYVSAMAGSDSKLVSHAELEGFPGTEQGGTVPTFAIRAGLPIGGRWGVEFEGAHSLTLERTVDATRGLLTSGANFAFGSATPDILRPIPITEITLESEERVSALNAVAWFRYTLNARLDLAFVGGATFARRSSEQRFNIQRPPLPPGFPPDLFPVLRLTTTRVVMYDVGPLVGAEAWLAFGDHVRVVPGVRLSAIASEWSVRPTAGVAWVF
jgi:hypothetical protein